MIFKLRIRTKKKIKSSKSTYIYQIRDAFSSYLHHCFVLINIIIFKSYTNMELKIYFNTLMIMPRVI